MSTCPNALSGSLRLGTVNAPFIGNQSRDRLSVSGNDNLFSLLDAIEKGAQCVLGFKSADFLHIVYSSLS